MVRTYPTPCLLIETVNYNLSNFSDELKSDITDSDLQTKLVILSKTFPQMKIIWSRSDLQTMQVWYKIKK